MLRKTRARRVQSYRLCVDARAAGQRWIARELGLSKQQSLKTIPSPKTYTSEIWRGAPATRPGFCVSNLPTTRCCRSFDRSFAHTINEHLMEDRVLAHFFECQKTGANIFHINSSAPAIGKWTVDGLHVDLLCDVQHANVECLCQLSRALRFFVKKKHELAMPRQRGVCPECWWDAS